MSQRKRLDLLVVERGLADSRAQARALILAGAVIAGEQRVDKPGSLVDSSTALRLKAGTRPAYVSRGGQKLEAGLRAFALDVAGSVALDVGASTGGFTDCLLQHGAAKVFAVDVGYGQLAWKLRRDPRVVNMERRHVRSLSADELTPTPGVAVIDASFISLTLIIPKVLSLTADRGRVLALVKPQFEVGKGHVGKCGVVRDSRLHVEVLNRLQAHADAWGVDVKGIVESPLRGPKGNVEFFLYLEKR